MPLPPDLDLCHRPLAFPPTTALLSKPSVAAVQRKIGWLRRPKSLRPGPNKPPMVPLSPGNRPAKILSTKRHPKSGSARRFLFKSDQTARLQFGPCQPHISGFADLLTQLGYSDGTGRHKIRLVAHFARWMEQRRVAPKELDEDQIARFLKSRGSQVMASTGDRATMALLPRYLRKCMVISPAPPTAPQSDIDLIEGDYAHFLRHERNLVPASIEQYLPVIRRFLFHRFRDGKVWLKKLTAKVNLDSLRKLGVPWFGGCV